MNSMEKQLLELVIEREKCLTERIEIINLANIPNPEKPIHCKLSDWENYVDRKSAYKNRTRLKTKTVKKLALRSERLTKKIIDLIPSSNVWFILGDGELAVAHQSDDWPGSLGKLKVKFNPDSDKLPKIHHQIIK